MQNKLSEGLLLNEKGELNEAGYAFNLAKEYNRKQIKGLKSRIKEWDYYYVGDDKYGIALTIADNSYMAMLSFSILDFENKAEIITKSEMSWLTFGKWNIPSTSKSGDLVVKKGKSSFAFYNNNGARRLVVKTLGKDKKVFECDINLEETNPNSMVIATPFKKKGHFYYNQKINLLHVTSGHFSYGDIAYDFKDDAYGVLDWGRGTWTYSNTWYWSSLNGIYNGHRIGFNLGYGFGDTSKASENMLFYDQEAFKLEDVKFNIPLDEKGKEKYLEPWTFTSSDGSINLTFEPILNRKAILNVVVLESNQNQVFGRFSGTFKVENKEIAFENVIGFAEKVRNRW